MSEKRFFDIFSRYHPTADKRELLDRGHSARFRYSKEPMRIEVDLSFDSHEDAELIYEIEDECRQLYMAESFKILPHFRPECFDMRYFDEIACEAALCGAVTNGFFTNAKYEDDGERITISIPFCDAGVDFVRSSGAEQILSNILESRYSIRREIKVVCGDGAEKRRLEWEKKRQEKLLEAEQASREEYIEKQKQLAARREEELRRTDPTYDFEAKSGISSATGVSEAVGESSYKMGATTYNFSGSEPIYGEDKVILDF